MSEQTESRVVVITGGTKGIGRALVEAFLKRDVRVVFCSRNEHEIVLALKTLRQTFAHDRVSACVCNVSVYDDVRALWDHAIAQFGRVDLWINNAGTSTRQRAFTELSADEITAVVTSNLLGTLHCAHVALRCMIAQGHGALYTMEGFGSDGAKQRGMSVYGSSKYAIRYLTQSLTRELKDSGVIVGSLGPGVVLTELLVNAYEQGDPALWARAKWWFRFIADPAETVASWLTERVLANRVHGRHFAYMTLRKAMLRLAQPRYHRRALSALYERSQDSSSE
ncbi:MAG: SDR family NAD(P)-dependent oxidoreductase [Deltaproteobacteria bacterium]|nr:SDR family NAD(P)-dependent oxidoreductase [Deltaproteobacteria bacterium]